MDQTSFEQAYGNGRPRKDEPKGFFISRVAQAAVRDLKQIGSFRKTIGGELFLIMGKPAGVVIPLEKGSIKLATLIQRRFYINASSGEIYNALVNAFQVEAFQYGEEVEIHQLCHEDIKNKVLYVSCWTKKLS